MADALTLVGRSSSHFTRVTRMFALELGVPVAFRPVLDMTSLDPAVLVMQGISGTAAGAVPPKVRRSLQNALGDLDARLEEVLAALPPERLVSFCEIALYCLVTHLPWRKVLAIDGYPRLAAFGGRYGERASARATDYRFDAA